MWERERAIEGARTVMNSDYCFMNATCQNEYKNKRNEIIINWAIKIILNLCQIFNCFASNRSAWQNQPNIYSPLSIFIECRFSFLLLLLLLLCRLLLIQYLFAVFRLFIIVILEVDFKWRKISIYIVKPQTQHKDINELNWTKLKLNTAKKSWAMNA